MTVRSGWDAERGWLVTELRDTVDVAAVETWRAGLTLLHQPDGGRGVAGRRLSRCATL